MIKICSWNIQAGGGQRAMLIVKAVVKSQSNILVFSEFRNNDSGKAIRNYLLRVGYRFQAVTDAARNDNSVFIASSLPFSSELVWGADDNYSSNIIIVHFKAFSIIGAYLPHKKKHTLFDYLITYLSETETPHILVGDLNTGINYVDQKGKSFWYEDDFKKITSEGYRDAFRLVNGDVDEYSWFSHQGNGYRYDHTIVSEQLTPIITDCYYKHEWRMENMSDHSPMFLELG